MQKDPKTGFSSTKFRDQSRSNPSAGLSSQVHQRGVDADADLVHRSPFFPQTFSTTQGWGEHQITHHMEKRSNPGFEHSSAPMFNSSSPYRPPSESQHVFGFGSGYSTLSQSFGSMIRHDGSMKRSATANPDQFIQHSAPPKFNPSYPYRPATEFRQKHGYGYGLGRGSSPPTPPQLSGSMRQCIEGPLDRRVRPRSNYWDPDRQPKTMTDVTDPPFCGTFLVGSPAWAIGPSGPPTAGPEQSEARSIFRNIAMQGRDGFMPKQMPEGHPFHHPPDEGTAGCSSPRELNLIRGLKPKLGVGDDIPSILSSDHATQMNPYMRCSSRDDNGNEEVNSKKSLDLTLRL